MALVGAAVVLLIDVRALAEVVVLMCRDCSKPAIWDQPRLSRLVLVGLVAQQERQTTPMELLARPVETQHLDRCLRRMVPNQELEAPPTLRPCSRPVAGAPYRQTVIREFLQAVVLDLVVPLAGKGTVSVQDGAAGKVEAEIKQT